MNRQAQQGKRAVAVQGEERKGRARGRARRTRDLVADSPGAQRPPRPGPSVTWEIPTDGMGRTLRVAALGHVLSITPTHVSPASPVERWSVQREGSMDCLDSRDSRDDARAAVEAGIVTAHATGRDLLEVLMDGADAHRRQESMREACECVADLARGRCFGARPDPSADLLERELFAAGLAAFLAQCRAAGWSVTVDGRVSETWKDRARGTWIDHVDVEFWEGAERGVQWLRVEDGFVCEVWSDSCVGEEPEPGSWVAAVDRSPGDRLYKHCRTVEEAQTWAVTKARKLAKVATTTKRANGRAA